MLQNYILIYKYKLSDKLWLRKASDYCG